MSFVSKRKQEKMNLLTIVKWHVSKNLSFTLAAELGECLFIQKMPVIKMLSPNHRLAVTGQWQSIITIPMQILVTATAALFLYLLQRPKLWKRTTFVGEGINLSTNTSSVKLFSVHSKSHLLLVWFISTEWFKKIKWNIYLILAILFGNIQ